MSRFTGTICLVQMNVQEEIYGSGPVSGNTMEASTFAIGDHATEKICLASPRSVHTFFPAMILKWRFLELRRPAPLLSMNRDFKKI